MSTGNISMGYLAITFFGLSPFFSAILSSAAGDWLGCNINEVNILTALSIFVLHSFELYASLNYYLINSLKLLFLITTVLFMVPPLNAQFVFTPGPYQPMDSADLFQQLDMIEQRATDAADPLVREVFAEAYTERTAGLKQGIRDSTFLFRADLKEGVERIFREIIQANALPVDPLILLSRSPVSNASSYGDGIFVVNVGLLESLTTWEELAFVMAHELAHDQLLHLRSRLMKRTELEVEPSRRHRRAFRRRVRREGVGDVMAELREKVYEQHRHGRANELSADSLAMHYLATTYFSPTAAVNALDNLEPENYFSLPPGQVRNLLNTKAYPFKSSWIKPPATMFGGSFGKVISSDSTAFWQKDSVATHPELAIRQTKLAELLIAVKADLADTVRMDHEYLYTAHGEIVSSYLGARMTAHTLILALKQLVADGPDDYYYAVAIDALLETHRAIGSYDFDRVVPPSRFFDDEGARTVVRMLQQMRAGEIRRLIMALLAEQTDTFPNSPHLRAVRKRAKLYFSSLD